ncbi:putative leucine rich repeat protein, partial [Phytophthora palmivora]
MTQKGTKETRTAEALAMKDEQMKILGSQNAQLLTSLNAMDDEIGTLKMHKLRLEEENRSLRDQNFELQSKARAAETTLIKAQ